MFDPVTPRDAVVGDCPAQAVPQEIYRVGRNERCIAGESRQKGIAARTRTRHAREYARKRASSWRFIGKQFKALGGVSRVAAADQQRFNLRRCAPASTRQEGLAAENGNGLVRTKPG